MHGRQKKERSVEEEAVKEKERAKKVAAYRHAMGIIFKKRDNGELDEDLLKITGQVLASNPDIGTLWNMRKEALILLKKLDYTKFVNEIVPKELDFDEFCLKNNPKSYGAWHHRYWLMKETNFVKVASELKLCAKYLEYDDRNFHGWDYRRFLLENSKEFTLDQELDFTTEKISSNFSNFSSWHLRSKLLPQLNKDYLDDELELIRNAVFTDPKDQSAWFYHRWLLKSQLPQECPSIIGVQLQKEKCIAVFNCSVLNPSQIGVKLNQGENTIEGIWTNPWVNTRSKLWEFSFPEPVKTISLQGDHDLMKIMQTSELHLNQGDVVTRFPRYFDVETQDKTEKLQNLFQEELKWVLELQELEPDIKWPVSTIIMLMRMIDFIKFKDYILKNLDNLIKLDPKRINYYLDLRSKYAIEWKLVENLTQSTCDGLQQTPLNLSSQGLTALYYPERMCFHTNVNLSENALKNSEPFRALVNCKELNIQGNHLSKKSIENAIQSKDTRVVF